ncbi:hypothetical protein [Sphingomonas radiodurans]|uniref:hypothetical protein n=1 Tax=Sphingomonas radiodurans TaxID=2890321 RepID=UPI001E56AB0F|nr:hypothetical protein [Sphingomonas radiodurans]WBH16009.1 hypothetical protein LLW23_14535 [Sphingomonas radiodurans]
MGLFGTQKLAEASTPAAGVLRLARPAAAAIDIDLAAARAIDFVRIGEAYGPADEGWWAITGPDQVVAARADCPMLDVLLRDQRLAAPIGDKAILWLMSRPTAFRGTRDGVAIVTPAAYAELTRTAVRETVAHIDDFPRID